ncbi:hypothetical protein [Parachlamydia acanthamoebae]|jgi:hypothetical protein|uniref:hypothetical protein n=1 Tax=Parachlamydia acanthamoebae TaxID=83552 RepID=UPI0001C177D2|nr:hypothetical protein [Parachlamydia acanthamoebae]EFB40278.1 hypothetical protein pah_c212o021 [Parachlamydia acanthamoebae str. Hall's coccus]
MKEITIPKKLALLIQAFSADEQSAKTLITEAAKTIYTTQESYGVTSCSISNEELEGVIALMRGINPKDTIEMIYGAQIVTSHLLGIKLLSHGFSADQALGLKLLRFCNEAMSQLQKKQSGGTTQNIMVNYNHNGHGPALMQTVISPKDSSCQ